MTRLHGLDFARFLALLGMVVVNFNVVMVNPLFVTQTGLASLLPGRAAALFVVLAGIGFGLAAQHKPWQDTFRLTLKRSLFLLILGLLNAVVFQADIIHYYAFYFMFGVLLLPLSNRYLVLIICGLILDFVLMAVFFNYDLGWDWINLHYQDFWTLSGFLRNLFFNGWHPIIPWLAFLLFGIILSRLKLQSKPVQIKLLVIGTLLFLLTTWLANNLTNVWRSSDAELVLLFTTEPIPPMPFYMLSAGALAAAIVGTCLLLEPALSKLRLLTLFNPLGQQTLTWYIAHILLGMGVLEALNKLGNQTPDQALYAAMVFCGLATLLAYLWSRYFKRGPLETLMRKLSG